MKYKVGDRVRIKSLDWYNENKDRIDEVTCGNTKFIPAMVKYCEGIVTISSVLPTLEVYHIKEDGGMFNWTDEMIEGLVEEEVGLVDNLSSRWVNEFNLPDGYIFKDENGNVINATKIVLEKKGKWYPKTYEECCVLLGAVKDRHYFFTKKDKDDYPNEVRILNVLDDLRRLLICRDAYWKIAGEEMGLGKPWKPDWTNINEVKFIIGVSENEIIKCCSGIALYILAFPTEEMRDAFYENFKEQIEECKELL